MLNFSLFLILITLILPSIPFLLTVSTDKFPLKSEFANLGISTNLFSKSQECPSFKLTLSALNNKKL